MGINFGISLLTGILVVILGFRSIQQYIQDFKIKQEIGQLKQFWSTGDNQVAGQPTYNIIFGVEPARDENEVEPRIGYTHVYGVFEVKTILEKLYEDNVIINLNPIQKDQSFQHDFFDNHVIIFGFST